MCWINNERYKTIIENVSTHGNEFVCSYLPVYGLIRVDKMILKSFGYKSFISSDKEYTAIKYITEKVYTDGFHGDELSEREIYKILINDEV